MTKTRHTIVHIVGARPNFMKAAPVLRALEKYNAKVRQILVHTGQHYTENMSDVFFTELGIPKPEVNLHVGSGTHAQQTAAIMTAFEPVAMDLRPALTFVYGDVNSTVAAALVCAKLGLKIVHVEAGLRSFDRTMPEEINRLLTDQLADLLFTPSLDGNANLKREGVAKNKVFFVGNVMIDTLIRFLPTAQRRSYEIRERYGLTEYGIATIHRPANVDDLLTLRPILKTLNEISCEIKLVFPVHPRTLKSLGNEAAALAGNMLLLEPLSYLDFLALQASAKLIITDSGGVQEEATYLRVPCLTLRPNTERPVTVTEGTNILIGKDLVRLRKEVKAILKGKKKKRRVPKYWDGRAAERIAKITMKHL
jgi:UDP-N-acetylglucosamine 2-epimerase (non-hydrolysing)